MYEFTGRTEQKAIERACQALQLDTYQFDVEVIGSEKGLFGTGNVKIRVYPHQNIDASNEPEADFSTLLEEAETNEGSDYIDNTLYTWTEIETLSAWQTDIVQFVTEILKYMEQDHFKINLYHRPENRILLSVQDPNDASLLIGKHGRHLESLQVILNAYTGRLHEEENSEVPDNLRVQLDIADYRRRREAKLVKLATDVASLVERRKNSRLLEAMSPSERHIIHQTLNDTPNISTISEGEGIYKQIRIIYREDSSKY